jgi:neutral trehalase
MTTARPATAIAISKQAQKLRKFLTEKATTCLHKPEDKLKYRYVTPTYSVTAGADDTAAVPERSTVGHYLQMYDWDACFFSQGATKVGLDNLAPDVVANFLSLKQADGYVPRTVSPNRIWDAGDMCKPFLCQALTFEDKYKAHKPSPEMVQDLKCYLEYFQRNRRHSSGLYHWRNVLESGVDDNLALLTPQEAAKDENESIGVFPDGKMLAVDLSAYLVAEFRAFAKLAEYAGNVALATEYREEAQKLMNLIEEKMWDEQSGIYFNLYPDTFEKLTLRSWTGLVPAMFGLSKQDRLEKVVKMNIMNKDEFLRPAGLSSTSSSEPLYNNAKRGLYGRAIVSNWQGPMWILPNALAVRGLLAHGFKKEAEEVAARVVGTVMKTLDERNTMYENYNAESGDPLWAPQFMSWNVLLIELVQLLE